MYKKILDHATRAWLSWQYSKLARIARFDLSEARIISGDPRGGTTWLAQLLNQLPGSALIWEPLAVSKVEEVRRLGFHWRQYIPETDAWPEATELFERILTGRLLSPYLCQQTEPQRLRQASHLLIKFCRANQLLPWLTTQFHLEFPPVYLVRHPCAVVASQLKQGGWKNVSPYFRMPEGRYASFYSEHAKFLRKIDTIEKRLAATWCLCNRVPLRHSDNNRRWITVTYESLLLNGPGEIGRIAERWKVSVPEHVYEGLRSASSTTVAGSPILQGSMREQLEYWKSSMTIRQIEDVMSVVHYFGIDLYNSEALPQRSFT